MQIKSEQQLTTTSTKIQIKLPVQTENGLKTATMSVDNSVPVHKNREFAKGIAYMIATFNKQESPSEIDIWMLVESCKHHKVKPKELYDAFFEASGDEFLPKTGMEFRHLFKFIKKKREGTYTPPTDGETMFEYQKRKAELEQGDVMKQLPESGKDVVKSLTDKMSVKS